MTLTPAMSRAQELHPPRNLPAKGSWDSDSDRSIAFQALNRVRAALVEDNWPAKVFAFHRLFKMPGGEGPIQQLSAGRRELRERLLVEEAKETIKANRQGDLVETVDGLLDTIYVAIGWLLELGLTPLQINLAMEEVHASNCTKVDENGQPVYDDGGKVLKGHNYIPCNLALVLELPTEEPSNGETNSGI